MRIHDSLAIAASFQFGLAGPLDCHVYVLRAPDGVVLIDAGAGTHTERLLANVRQDFGDVAVRALVLTHCHADHAGGAAEIRRLTGCAVYAPKATRPIVENADEEAMGLRAAREAGVYPAEFRVLPCPVDGVLKDGEKLSIAGLPFTPIHVRGHSRDAFCLLAERQLFSGDVLFYGGILGLINAEGSEMAGYRADLHKLAGLAVEGLFPGHGMFTLRGGQRHIDCAIAQAAKGFIPRQVGQWDLIF
ncbi:MAG TPA: MBL fold metallo-hydrolase [Bryobacteraceae bacterium]|nr:MBL fold metallo-hydrolase [Bryobacteraceae bacterium]